MFFFQAEIVPSHCPKSFIGNTECHPHEVPFPSVSTYAGWPRCGWTPSMTGWQKMKSKSHWSQALWSLSWSPFPLVFNLGSIGVLALTSFSITTANINNKPAHSSPHRGLLMWHSEVNSFSCLPPQHDFRLLIHVNIFFFRSCILSSLIQNAFFSPHLGTPCFSSWADPPQPLAFRIHE